MALGAKQEKAEKQRAFAAIAPISPPDQPCGMVATEHPRRSELGEYEGKVPGILETPRKQTDRASKPAHQACAKMFYRAQDLGRHVQAFGRFLKQQYPVRLLAIFAGGAFIAGITIRVWRFRAS